MENLYHKIIYTKTDEAPMLATYSLLPIIEAFTAPADVRVEIKDISLAHRILAVFPDYLTEDQRVTDDLSELGELVTQREANIIKLPNISASVPQLKAAIKELQEKGYALPDYPKQPQNEKEEEIKNRYDKVKGSAVNPVLREGNSDRRAPKSVKAYAKQNPHRMGKWSADSKSHVASMESGDFYESERSFTSNKKENLALVFTNSEGEKTVLKENVAIEEGEIVDAAVLNKNKLVAFLKQQITDAKNTGVLFSVHLKATMMKVSDPVIFGHVVRTFFQPVFEKFDKQLQEAGILASNGMSVLLQELDKLEPSLKTEILEEIEKCYQNGPDLAMVNSDKGITNLHVPSDVIIDASMPAMIRTSGQMWNADGNPQDTKAVIPDRSYAGVYQETIDFCKKHGAFDPTTMGSVSNVGLMAKKAEEYGSHDTTFILPENGTVEVQNKSGETLLSHTVEEGDIWRLCRVKDEAIRDWVKLAVRRAKETKNPAVFWLDSNRSHDSELIKKVNQYLADEETHGLEIKIMAPIEATRFSLERAKNGLDTISVTGNVLRDYLTDLFPILEVGTSAKMLSIVPLMNGGGLFETGAGGSAPKHIQQFVEEGHLRWDSLGEFMALVESLRHYADVYDSANANILADALEKANEDYLMNDKSPSRKVHEPDNRASHYYLALYWAKALSEQNENANLSQTYAKVYEQLRDNESRIIAELDSAQGDAVNIGGYYYPDDELTRAAMRPSGTLNRIIGG